MQKHFGHRYFGGRVIRLGTATVVKVDCQVAEAQAMNFVGKNTGLPVPRVLRVFSAKGKIHIMMECIDAPLLHDCWEGMSRNERKDIVIQLCDFLRQVRALPPLHPGKVHGAGGLTSQLHDRRERSKPFGPFDTVDQFHEFIGLTYLREHVDEFPTFQPHFEKCAGRIYGTRFTHGDFAPYNIMVKGGKVVGIIDWECAGWYPEYWEYTTCYRSSLQTESFWDMMKDEMDSYSDELEVEHCISSFFIR